VCQERGALQLLTSPMLLESDTALMQALIRAADMPSLFHFKERESTLFPSEIAQKSASTGHFACGHTRVHTAARLSLRRWMDIISPRVQPSD